MQAQKCNLNSDTILEAIETAIETPKINPIQKNSKTMMASKLLRNGALMKTLVKDSDKMQSNIVRLIGIFAHGYATVKDKTREASSNITGEIIKNCQKDIGRVLSRRWWHPLGINFSKRINGSDNLMLEILHELGFVKNQEVVQYILKQLSKFDMQPETMKELNILKQQNSINRELQPEI